MMTMDWNIAFYIIVIRQNTSLLMKSYGFDLLNNPFYIDSLFREGRENATVMLVKDANAFDEGDPVRINFTNKIKVIMDDATLFVNYWIVGTTTLNVALNTYSLHDVFTFYLLVFAICIIFGWWVFGNWCDLTVALSIILAVIATTIQPWYMAEFH